MNKNNSKSRIYLQAIPLLLTFSAGFANAQTFNATWNSTSDTATGSITFTDITSTFNYLPTNLSGPYSTFDPVASGISAFSVTVNGSTYSIAGGEILNIVRRSTGLTFTDLNIFLSASGTGCTAPGSPAINGSTRNTFTFCGGVNRSYLLDLAGFNLIVSTASGPSATDTYESLRGNANSLLRAYGFQNSRVVQGLANDCSAFDSKKMCAAFIAGSTDGKGFNGTNGSLVIAHKVNPNFRFGGYLNQGASSSISNGLTAKKGSPDYGVFGVWAQNPDGSGVELRASANVGKLDMETNRTAVGSAEAGVGKSDIKSSGFQLEVSRDYAVNNAWSARPYLGYRKTTHNRAGYAEESSNDVTAPLNYTSLKQNTETALAGVRFGHQLSEKTGLTLSAGIEHDIKNTVDGYEAINAAIGDIESVAMTSNMRKTRPTMSFGLNHSLGKTQRIGVSLALRKEAFEARSTTSAMVQYSVGF